MMSDDQIQAATKKSCDDEGNESDEEKMTTMKTLARMMTAIQVKRGRDSHQEQILGKRNR